MFKFLLFYLVACYFFIRESDAIYNGEETKLNIADEELRPFKFALSPNYLPELAQAEKTVYKIIKKFSRGNKNEEIRVRIEKYILDFEESGVNLKSNWEGTVNFTKNPISSYRMLRRFAKDFLPFEESLKNNNETETLDKLNKLKKETKGFPDEMDLDESLKGLLAIQDFYDLKANKIARGKLIKMETGVRLNPSHCLEIAKFAMENEFYTFALDWLGAAEDVSNGSIGKDIKKSRNDVILKHDKNWETNMKEEGNHYSYSSKLNSIDSLAKDEKRTMKEIYWEKYVGNLTIQFGHQLDFNMFALCKGVKLISSKQESSLFCWLDSKRHPYWIVNPLKIELKSKSPHISVIHDVIPNSWINLFIKTASKIQRRTPRSDYYNSPTSSFGWIHPEGFPNIPIETRNEMLFNLKTGKEVLQVNSYALGAWLNPHLDLDGDNKIGENQMRDQHISSNIYYLTDVEEGGATVFPALGIQIEPLKGSVLMWYNLYRSGDWDRKMVHASCPVVFGHKWSTLKKTYSNLNWLKRPCHLDKTK